MRIGLFGGTFDPVHHGHLNLALGLFEARQLDEVWFCPAKWNPHKDKGPAATFHQRVEMLKLALVPLPAFSIIEVEGEREGVSYTFDTVKHVVESYPEKQFYLLMGDEAAEAFYRWQKPEAIVDKVSLLVGARQDRSMPSFKGSEPVKEALKRGWTPLPLLEISATEIRYRMAHGLFVGHLVPEKVLDYIVKHRLYSSSWNHRNSY